MPQKKKSLFKKSVKKQIILNRYNFFTRYTFILLIIFAAIGVYTLWNAFEASNQIVYSGQLTPNSPTQSYNFSAQAGGNATAKLSYKTRRGSTFSVTFENSAGKVIAQQSRRSSPVNLSQNVAAGNYKVIVGASNLSRPINYKLTLTYPTQEESGPAVAISSPLNNATVASDVKVTGTASALAGISNVKVSIDNGSLQSASGTTSWTYTLKTSSLTNAAHSIKAIVTDTKGVTASSTVTVNVNNSTGGGGGQTSGIWIPALKTPWMWELDHPLDVNNSKDMATGVKDYLGNAAPNPLVYDIDGFETPASTVSALHAKGLKTICYISAGTWEDWRSDAGNFPSSVKRNDVDGWPHEKWLDISQVSALEPIMKNRVNMCKSKGFDSIEFDNVDGYANSVTAASTGLKLIPGQQITYNTDLANWAHQAGLSAALKNDIDQVPDLWKVFDFAINEECNRYKECGNYPTYFVANKKAVFQVEYQGTLSNFCPAMNSGNINSQLMTLSLNGSRTPCR